MRRKIIFIGILMCFLLSGCTISHSLTTKEETICESISNYEPETATYDVTENLSLIKETGPEEEIARQIADDAMSTQPESSTIWQYEEGSVEDIATESTTAITIEIETETTAEIEVNTNKEVELVYTDIVYKGITGDKSEYRYYNSLKEAKADLKVKTLTDDEAHEIGIHNSVTYSAEAEEVFQLINEYRASLGLNALSRNSILDECAMHRAAESAYSGWNMTALENGTTKRHIRPNFNKASSIKEYYGISGNFGENYARFFETPNEVIEGWKSSTSHNALLTGAGTEIGIGIAADEGGYLYWIVLIS